MHLEKALSGRLLKKEQKEGPVRRKMSQLTLLEGLNEHIMNFDIIRIGFHQDDWCNRWLECASKMCQSPLVNHL